MRQLLALLIALSATGPLQQTRDGRVPSALGTAAISGVVLSDEPQPRPLRRARVLLNGPVGNTAITEDDGTFAFKGLPPGSYTVGAVKDGYVPMNFGARRTGRRGTSIALAQGGSANVAISLPKGAVITGIVTDVDGLPTPGAAVQLHVYRFNSRNGERELVERISVSGPPMTDDRGVYRAYGLPPGEYVVSASRPNLAIQMRSTASQTLVAAPVYYPGTVKADEAAAITLRVGEERGAVDVQLLYVSAATIKGTVAGLPTGAHVSVTLNRMDGAGQLVVRHPSASGEFTFTGVRPGNYLLVARAALPADAPDAPQISTAEVSVDGKDVSVTVSPASTVSIVGNIVFEGAAETRPILEGFNAHGMATLKNTSVVLSPIKHEPDGRFGIRGNIPGLYQWTAELPGLRGPIEGWWLKSFVVNSREVLDAPLELTDSTQDASLTFTRSASELTGLVRDAKDQPDVARRVVAFSTDRRHWFFHSRRVAAVRTTDDGRFSVRNLPPGEYFVAIDREELDDNEWFDPVILERLRDGASKVRIEGTQKIVCDFPAR